MSTSPSDLAKFLGSAWYRAAGLVTSVVLALVFLTTAGVSADLGMTAFLGTLLGGELLVYGLWAWTRRIPRVPRGKIGLVVGITSSDDAEALRMREDFVVPLGQLVREGESGRLFHFVTLRAHIAESLTDHARARSVREASRAQFLLYGRVRLRTIDGSDHHVIDLFGLVTHSPIPENEGREFSREFSMLLPNRIAISTENDLFSFEITSQWTDVVARYIIGLAMAYSGRLEEAEELYCAALERLEAKGRRFPIYQHLAAKLPLRISELYEGRAYEAHLEWVETHDPGALRRLDASLAKIHESRRQDPMVLTLSAINAFLTHRNTSQALALVRSAPRTCNLHVNEAFLLAYEGDLRGAAKCYRRAARCSADPKTLSQAEDFMCWVLNQEPKR